MAHLRSRSGPSSSRNGVRSEEIGTLAIDTEFAGVDTQTVRTDPDSYVGELFQGPHFYDVNVPSQAPAGGTLTIDGTVHLDNIGVSISNRPVRVVLESPYLSDPKIQEVGELKHCQSKPFSFEVPAPQTAGQQLAITLKAQSNTYGAWGTGEEDGPHRVNIVSKQEYEAFRVSQYLPWALGGAAAGYAGSQFTGGSPAGFAAAGGALGVAGQGFLGDGPVLPSLGGISGDVALLGAGALGVAALLSVSGADEVASRASSAAAGALPSRE